MTKATTTRRLDLPGSSILIVNDQPVTRFGIRQFVEKSGAAIAEASDSAEAATLLKELRPKLLLTEIRFFSDLCFDFIEASRVNHPGLKILVLSGQPEVVFAERVIRAGADGYISANAATSEIVAAISCVMSGEIYLSTFVERQIVQRVARSKRTDLAADPCASLSNRELDILHRLGNGFAPREIANDLTLSVKTIESYRDRLKDKLGMTSTFELLRFALECQIFGLDTKEHQKKKVTARS